MICIDEDNSNLTILSNYVSYAPKWSIDEDNSNLTILSNHKPKALTWG